MRALRKKAQHFYYGGSRSKCARVSRVFEMWPLNKTKVLPYQVIFATVPQALLIKKTKQLLFCGGHPQDQTLPEEHVISDLRAGGVHRFSKNVIKSPG